MFIQKQSSSHIYAIILCMIFLFGSCVKAQSFEVEIADLEGSWIPDWSYRLIMEEPEEKREEDMVIQDFSWGKGLAVPNYTHHIDLVKARYMTDIGSCRIMETIKVGKDTIKIHLSRGAPDDPVLYHEFDQIFHFVDKDTMWIEGDSRYGWGKDNLWHRLSGPGRISTLRTSTQE